MSYALKSTSTSFSKNRWPALFMYFSSPRCYRCRLSFDVLAGKPCATAEHCRFDYDLCVNGICKVNPSVQEDASVKTTVSVSANAYDTRLTGDHGCGDTGCLPTLMRDGSTLPESRWSCSKNLGEGNCYVEYTFDEPQDVISMNIAFYRGDERKRTVKVGVLVNDTLSSTRLRMAVSM